MDRGLNGTPLSQVAGLAIEDRRLLESRWLETAEEAAAALAGWASGEGDQREHGEPRRRALMSSLLGVIQPDRRAAIEQAPSGGPLGCLVDPERWERFRRRGGSREGGGFGSVGMEADGLPEAIRLTDRLPPVRDQGERPTCVAFATVALKEYIEKSRERFSEQFLYWACKQLDGVEEAGTYLHAAAGALELHGCCLNRTWPYVNRNIPGNEGQGPPPPTAVAEAREHRTPYCRVVAESVVEHYKRVLAGGEGTPGMPVVIGLLVFNSWYRSAETHRTGKITLPFPGELPVGAHAMCVVGYVDDESVPGGGYFILRNSWGGRWAAENPEGAGHALLPYAYLGVGVVGAFTGPVGAEPKPHARRAAMPAVRAPTDPAFGPVYTRVLDLPARDADQVLVPARTAVIVDPANPACFKRDTPANRRMFWERDCTWTDESRRRRWFVEGDLDAGEAVRRFEPFQVARESFVRGVRENLQHAVGAPFPYARPPAWLRWVPWEWEPRIRGCAQVADLTDEWLATLPQLAGGPPELAWPRSWLDRIAAANSVQVHAWRRGRRLIWVVAAFVTPLRLRRDREPVWEPVSARWFEALERLVAKCMDQGRKPDRVIYTIGSATGFSSELMDAGKARGDLILSEWRSAGDRGADGQGEWLVRWPRCWRQRREVRTLALAVPEPWDGMRRRVEAAIGRLGELPGSVTVGKVAGFLGMPPGLVEAFFVALQARGKGRFRLHYNSRGELAIREAPGLPVTVRRPGVKGGWIRRHLVRLTALAVALLFTRLAWLAEQHFHGPGWWRTAAWLVFLLIVYVGSLVQARINQAAEEEVAEA